MTAELTQTAPEDLVPGGPDGPPPFLDDYLEHWAAEMGDRAAHTFVDYSTDLAGVSRTLTWSELNRRSRAVAAAIARLSGPGERVAVLAPQGTEYVVGVLGALRSGAIGVPLFAPDLFGHADRVTRVLDDCRPTCLLTTSDKRGVVGELDVARGATIVCVDELDAAAVEELAGEYRRPDGRRPRDCAYLQYTSGSTRAPAGVQITYANLVSNAHQLRAGHHMLYGQQTGVCWLPLFHDMGLILGALCPVLVGGHSVLLDPLAFIASPVRWIRALAEHDHVLSGAPNFAYDYAAKRVRDGEKEGLDLSRVDSLSNGAEPVRPDTLAAFHEAFADCGLRPEAMSATYGLAEATVLVSVSRPRCRPVVLRLDADALQRNVATTAVAAGGHTIELVSCGPPIDQTVAIVDPRTREPLPEGRVGEIWIHGPNVASGYWNKPDESEAAFGGHLQDAGALPAHPWLRTGDLGTLIDGELFITGRMKDLIIVDGRNVYPQDIELTVETAHPAVAQRRLAAFGVRHDESEAIVVVAERYRRHEDAASSLPAIARAVRRAVSERHGVGLHDFVLVEPDTVTRTSSGKIARQATRAAYLEGTLVPVVADG